jgi:hypothetical protein
MSAGGRPSTYTPELESKILAALSEQSMVAVCARPDMPSRETLYQWMHSKAGFADKYARACEERADHRAEKIDEIAEKVLSGEVDPQAARVAIDAHKWTASKLKPKRYGDRIDLGNADGVPFQINVIKDFGSNNNTP